MYVLLFPEIFSQSICSGIYMHQHKCQWRIRQHNGYYSATSQNHSTRTKMTKQLKTMEQKCANLHCLWFWKNAVKVCKNCMMQEGAN